MDATRLCHTRLDEAEIGAAADVGDEAGLDEMPILIDPHKIP